MLYSGEQHYCAYRARHLYVFYRHGSSFERKSETKKKTLNPEWNLLSELLLPQESELSEDAASFDFEVWDWDLGKGDDFLGRLSLSLIEVKEAANSQVHKQ